MSQLHLYEQKTVSLEKTELAKTARKQLSAVAAGNGLRDEQIRLVTTRERMYDFPGYLIVKIKADYATNRVMGNAAEGIDVRSEDEMVTLAEEKASELLTDEQYRRDVIQLIKDFSNQEEFKKMDKNHPLDPGDGYGLHGYKIPIPIEKPVFSMVEQCLRCNGQGKDKCPECHGSCRTNCPECKATGKMLCPACMGQKKVAGPGGEMINCMTCHGWGKIQCKKCMGQMTLQCLKCGGSGITKCSECHGHGWFTTVTHVNYTAVKEFEIDKTGLPDSLAKAINDLKPWPLRLQGHAKTELIGDNDEERDPLTLIYQIRMPFAEAEYVAEDDPVHCKVIGFNVVILDCDHFLDPLIKPGIYALSYVAKGEKPPSALIKASKKYRAVREALSWTSGHTRSAVVKRLLQTYKIGLSSAYAKALAHQSHLALKKISTIPRYIGLALGTVFTAGAIGYYHLGGARDQLAQFMPNSQAVAAFDIALPFLMLFITIYTIKYAAKNAVMRVAPASTGLPRVGQAGSLALIAILVIWLGIVEISFTQQIAPSWYEIARERFLSHFK